MKTVLAALLLILLLLQYRLWLGSGSLSDLSRLEGAITRQQAENSTLAARNDTLMEEVSDLRNGLDSIEERARGELGMIHAGETFYLIVDKRPELATEQESPPVSLASPELALDPVTDATPEPPPEIVEDDNPYLDMFRDDAATDDETTAN